MDIGSDGIEEEVTYEWASGGRRRLPYNAYVRIGAPQELEDKIVAEMIRYRKRTRDQIKESKRMRSKHAAAYKALAVRNAMAFDDTQNAYTAREALFFVGPSRIGTSIDFSDFQGKDYMHIFHLSLRLVEDFDLSISNNQIALSPSSALSEESRNSLMHGGHTSDFNYASGNPATVGPFFDGHWPQQVAASRQPDGSIITDLFVLFSVDPDYHTYSQIKANRGVVFHASMVRSPETVTPSMIIRCRFPGGNIDLQDETTEFTVLFADGNMNNRLDLPLDHESFVVTGQGVFTRGYYEMMAKEGKVDDYIDLLPDVDVDASQSYEVDDIADEMENTSVVEECHMTQRAKVLSCMAQNGSSDIALISTLQETFCGIEDMTSSRAMNLLCDPSSSFRSTVADLALHESRGVCEQAKELLEAVVTHASQNLPHRDGSLARRIVEQKQAEALSAKRKAEHAEDIAAQQEGLDQLRNDIERRRQMLKSSSSGEATASCNTSFFPIDDDHCPLPQSSLVTLQSPTLGIVIESFTNSTHDVILRYDGSRGGECIKIDGIEYCGDVLRLPLRCLHFRRDAIERTSNPNSNPSWVYTGFEVSVQSIPEEALSFCTLPTASPSPPPLKRQKLSTIEFMFKFQSSKSDHSFKTKLSSFDTSNIPDPYRRVLSDTVFDSRKKLSTAPVDKFTRVISSQHSEVFQAKLYPNKHDESDCKLFIAKYNHLKEIPCWKVADKVWVYVVPPFALSQMGIADGKRMRIAIVNQS
eukprot:scaffold10708_cov157-Skeletonema_dohrnii-CCMP3373.AAC.2